MYQGRYKMADIFNRIFMNENMIVSNLISLKFILQDLINDKPAFAWYRVGVARRQSVILTDNLNQSNINPSSGLRVLTMYGMFCFFVYKHVWTMS